MTHAQSSKSQRYQLAKYIREHGSINTFQAHEIGIMAPAPRVMELKEEGLNIVANYMTIEDKQGVKHPQVAVYSLDGKHE